MGNCATEDNPTFRTLNSNENQFRNNIYSQEHSESSISYDKSNNIYPTYTNNGVYKINRKKKQSNKKLNKIDYFNNIYPIKDNNTNNSTTSKSKFTDSSFPAFSQGKSLSNIHSENFMRINTMESDKSGSNTDLEYINGNMNMNNFNKNFQEKKKLIRRKIHSSDKALEIMTLAADLYPEDYRIPMRQAEYCMIIQGSLLEDERDYSKVLEYYEKAKTIYDKVKVSGDSDDEMQRLENDIEELYALGWLE
jgi:tetratricopeptide (TPR) repeat protein